MVLGHQPRLGFRSLSAGQLNGPLVLAYPLVLLALRRKRDGMAGFIAAAAALFKLSPGILFLYFLWKGRWRAAGWMAAWGAALMACVDRLGRLARPSGVPAAVARDGIRAFDVGAVWQLLLLRSGESVRSIHSSITSSPRRRKEWKPPRSFSSAPARRTRSHGLFLSRCLRLFCG